MRNDKIEKYLMFITVLLLIMIALQIPILARASESDGWEPIILPEPLTVENQIVPTQFDGYVEQPEVTNDEVPQMTEEELIRSVITERQEKKLAQTLYGEDRNCGGPEDTMKQAAVIWSIFNRCDAYGQTVDEVITRSQYHGWFPDQQHPQWAHEIVRDVALRWAREKMGETDVGRVLPPEYLFFSAGGRHEKFRTGYRTSDYWDWSAENPYYEGE